MAANVTRDIIVVGASAGGVQALQQLVSKLPSSLPASLFVVLHIWPASQSHLADILSRAGPLPAEHATNEAPIRRGRVYVAPSDFHLLIEEGRMLVLRGPKENRFRPAINPLFRSAAAAYRNRVIGVILTGLLDDGAAGLWGIKQCGGITLRALKESAALDQRLADRSNHHGLRAAAEAHKNNADQKLAQADEIQTFLLQLRPADVTPAK